MTDEKPPPLEPLTEDWERALCVVAHPDDMEFGGAAAVARWTGQGKQVIYCMVTSGEAGIDGMVPDESRRVREAEQVESARIVGVDEVDEDDAITEASADCAEGTGDGIRPGGAGWVTVRLAPGRYELVCNLPGHYRAGMVDEIVVR
jgi:uncharacterized cupredoxin-like copper-binding protein